MIVCVGAGGGGDGGKDTTTTTACLRTSQVVVVVIVAAVVIVAMSRDSRRCIIMRWLGEGTPLHALWLIFLHGHKAVFLDTLHRVHVHLTVTVD